MSFEEFVTRVRELLEEYISEEPKLSIYTALKNNGCERKGITFYKKDNFASPTIYLEEYYERFKEGQKIEYLASEIADLYASIQDRDGLEGAYFQDYNNVKNQIVYKIINTRKNEKLLSQVPHKEYLDLSIVYMVLVEMNEDGTQMATMLIRNEHIDWWEITEQELHDRALFNTPKLLPYGFWTMYEVMMQMLTNLKSEEYSDYLEEDSMYVLSNSSRTCGASVILYPGLLKVIGHELNEDYYMIPSSIHEVIIIPKSSALSGVEMKGLVKEVNREMVHYEEVLSDHVYYYDREVEMLTIAE